MLITVVNVPGLGVFQIPALAPALPVFWLVKNRSRPMPLDQRDPLWAIMEEVRPPKNIKRAIQHN